MSSNLYNTNIFFICYCLPLIIYNIYGCYSDSRKALVDYVNCLNKNCCIYYTDDDSIYRLKKCTSYIDACEFGAHHNMSNRFWKSLIWPIILAADIIAENVLYFNKNL